jgi:2,4-dienoyl-CoA reductase-like NADH-dependent reductase (Old Yellow Enzyme family)
VSQADAPPALFRPLALRGVTAANRIGISPMCMYSADDGVPTEWHMVHLGSRALGGAGLVMAEATAVEPVGRISPQDTGLWNDAQAAAFGRIAAFGHTYGARMGIQIAHAGRKASTHRPWSGEGALSAGDGGWEAVAPSALPHPGLPTPNALTVAGIAALVEAFGRSAALARQAQFDVLEVHAAHGYLINEFLSPLANLRTDAYGGDFSGRCRFLFEVLDAVRAAWDDDRPLFVRISATDWAAGGWDLEDSVRLCRELVHRGVDLVDCSTGGVADYPPEGGPGNQVAFAQAIRVQAHIATAAVGRIEDPLQADAIVRDGNADMVMVGRASLRDADLGRHWAQALGVRIDWPVQHDLGRPEYLPSP